MNMWYTEFIFYPPFHGVISCQAFEASVEEQAPSRMSWENGHVVRACSRFHSEFSVEDSLALG